jgi:hypothetical protein
LLDGIAQGCYRCGGQTVMRRTLSMSVRSGSLRAASGVIGFLLSLATIIGPTTAPLLHADDTLAADRATHGAGVHGPACPHEEKHPCHDGSACLVCRTLQQTRSSATAAPRAHTPVRRGEAVRTAARIGGSAAAHLSASEPRAPPVLS